MRISLRRILVGGIRESRRSPFSEGSKMRLLVGVGFLVVWVQTAVPDFALSDDGTFYSPTAVGMSVRQGCSSCGCVSCGCSGFSGTSVLIGSRLGVADYSGGVAEVWPFAAGPTFPPLPRGNYVWSPGSGYDAVHYRYPYYSYRRPWAHPGPLVPNVTIIW